MPTILKKQKNLVILSFFKKEASPLKEGSPFETGTVSLNYIPNGLWLVRALF